MFKTWWENHLLNNCPLNAKWHIALLLTLNHHSLPGALLLINLLETMASNDIRGKSEDENYICIEYKSKN